ncbi:type 1 glutamine amidotransferase domain-containing protein [Aerosticca soli]|uniref:ThiJ/PfpI family protein n=1 Tax=Aerosticca soli TaxID=2010829 RepID=A0A2Z6E4N2_9GAMM|nr:type 1 glutamine amidotransferase domain-containing protein [Aerosticca soli]MDI3262068.1 type 1 glutamine amidotransferase domain-containing protein [Fulvimonas sp.]BBD79469.1 ThiJ/PfpI family protein [Aerosticca soli]
MTSHPRLSGRKIAILATHGFEYSELTEPKRQLEQAGATVKVVAPDGSDSIKGWKGGDWADAVKVDLPLSQARVEDFDALVLPGGVLNPDQLRLKPEAIQWIARFGHAGKLIAAICHGPWTLIDAGLVKGRRVTSWPSLRKDLENAGAQWEDSQVVRDDKLITSRKPDDIPAFVQAIVEALAG